MRTVPKVKVPTPTKPRVYSFTIQNISTRTRKVFRPTPIGDIGLSGRRRGGPFPFLPEMDIFIQPLSVSYKDKKWFRKQSSTITSSSITI